MSDALLPPDSADPTLPLHTVRPAGLESLRSALPPEAATWLQATGFRAQPGRLALLPGGAAGLSGAVLGLGEDPASPWSFGALPFALPEGSAWRLEPGDHDSADAVLGWLLGAYRFRRYKSAGPDRAPARLLAPPGCEAALASAEAICRARDLINTPAADLGPAELAAAVAALAEAQGAHFEEISGAALEEGFPAVAAVGQAVGPGSPRAPRVAVLRWEGPGAGPEAPLVALCGKGVCFDTGGLDLKPAEGMKRMKKDMGGAAVVLGLAEVLMRRGLPIRLLVLVGAVENAVSATAMRPLDVLRTRKGLTVEVGNTDAEGRLVLADLLAHAAEHAPALIVDCATLTGAARVALGPELPALFTNDDTVAEAFLASGRSLHDEMWRLPLHHPYYYWLDSAVADVNNIGSKPMAGSVIAALFLSRFVPPGQRWAHLDVYAWNDSGRPGRPEGGEGQAIRALAGGIASLFGAPHNLNR